MFGHERGIQFLVVPASRKGQANRIARRLKGRKCDVEVKHSKGHTLIKIYQ